VSDCTHISFLSQLKTKLQTDTTVTIAEIKATLSITKVLAHYGLEAGPKGAMRCPFHDDKAASMKVYADTNTAYCFAGGCEVESVDVIDFVLHMEKCDKRTAILKAKELCGQSSLPPPTPQEREPVAPELDVKAIYAASLETIQKHKAAQAYCLERGLVWWDWLGVGYKSRKTSERWGRGCILLPLRDRAGRVVSLYGRAIKGKGHYYTAGRRGLYPYYPDASTRTLVLTESVLDAASLRRYEFSLDGYAILALYGTNGLTAEHRTVIGELGDLREIILALDSDEAGNAAAGKLATELTELRGGLTVTRLPLPAGADVNAVTAAAGDNVIERVEELLAERTVMATSPVKSAPASAPKASIPTISRLDTANPYCLEYVTATASYQVRGGVRLADKDLDSLKVTLLINNAEGRKSRQKVDLYEDRQVSRTARAVAERLGLRADLVELDLDSLTEALDDHRERLRREHQDGRGKEDAPVDVTGTAKSSCETFLRQPQLLHKINEQIGKAGLVGEEANRLLLFVVASSYRMPQTLHALIQGASGSGKTRLARVVSELIPPEVVKRYTRVTDGSFYNQAEHYFTNKLLCFEDIDGLKEEALLAVRELQSNEVLITSTSYKDELGNIRGAERIVRGPIASLSCTTRAEVYEDNVSRCFVVAVDESQEQSQRVIEYQNRRSAGRIEGRDEAQARELLRNCLRLLQPLEVINPYADRLRLPEEAHKLRRLNELYQSFVRQVTLLNQLRRKRDDRGRLITEVEDLRVACEVLFESIVLKVDELDGSLRQFFERLKAYVLERGRDYEFTRFEVRKATGLGKTQQHHHLTRLLELEYLTKRGFANRGYRYRVSHWDDQGALRQRIKDSLLNQLNHL
jgi:DNA primase/energy-coupling factor transporter ATP-binding protein EcfA2